MRSLQSRLSSGLLLSLIVIFSILWWLVSSNIQALAEDYIASRLKHDTETLLNRVSFNQQGKLLLDVDNMELIYKQPFSGHYFVISSADKLITSRSLWDQNLAHKNLLVGQQKRQLQVGPEQQSLLLLSSAYKKQSHTLTITVAEDLNPINKNIDRFKYNFAALATGMLLALVILQVFILRKSLTPLKKIQADIKLLQQAKLNKLSTNFPTELQPLINEVNHLLELMQQRLTRSRNSLGDLAHAIKKPLTVIKQIVDKNNISEEGRETLIKQADDIYQTSDRILKRARLAGHAHSGALFSFDDDLPPLIKTLKMMYGTKSLTISYDIKKNICTSLDREDMLELLGNLLDNACKWAKNKVLLNVNQDNELHICIEDDGVGADPKKLNALSVRGVRLDEKKQGHGFGLAISSDIIKAYNGRIDFTNSAHMGGFKVEIVLPLQRASV